MKALEEVTQRLQKLEATMQDLSQAQTKPKPRTKEQKSRSTSSVPQMQTRRALCQRMYLSWYSIGKLESFHAVG